MFENAFMWGGYRPFQDTIIFSSWSNFKYSPDVTYNFFMTNIGSIDLKYVTHVLFSVFWALLFLWFLNEKTPKMGILLPSDAYWVSWPRALSFNPYDDETEAILDLLLVLHNLNYSRMWANSKLGSFGQKEIGRTVIIYGGCR